MFYVFLSVCMYEMSLSILVKLLERPPYYEKNFLDKVAQIQKSSFIPQNITCLFKDFLPLSDCYFSWQESKAAENRGNVYDI